ncbi:MAG: NAD-dependent epimerase/dehydratase family protein [Solirubrobacterales bacterium]|nr:NAD-dependent epimerase/dehydratase family protein [Solirubrobacterales bacterium]
MTGATGFIGGHLARRLLREGYRVRCLVRESSDTSLLEALGAELARGDLTDARSLTAAARGCRFVLHCGALVSDWATINEIKRINVDGTRNVLEASTLASAERFVHVSTTDVYGYPGRRGVDEHHRPAGFSNWYAETKRAAEAEVRRVEQGRDLNVVILRPATVYGPRSEDVVGDMAQAMRRRQMLLVDGGRAVAGLLYIENLVDAAVLTLRSDAGLGEAFNLTDGLDITWRRFLADLAEGLGYPEPRWSVPYGVAFGIAFGLEYGYRFLRRTARINTRPLLSRQAVHVLGRDQDFSNRKARETLGWAPRVSYQDGLAATIKWLREEYLISYR